MKVSDALICLNPKCDHLYDSTEHTSCPYCGEKQALTLRKYFEPMFFKKCTCGRTYSKEQWEALTIVGIQEGTYNGKRFYHDLELRSCSCGTTLAVQIVGKKDNDISITSPI